jgi:hypothetical protein
MSKLKKIAIDIRRITNKKDSLISFDIFDTLVRRVVSPEQVLKGICRYILGQLCVEITDDNILRVLKLRTYDTHLDKTNF